MREDINGHITCKCSGNEINWACKVCKDLPNYAGMYLYQREIEKNQLNNEDERCADLKLLKYYYALLCLLGKIHGFHESTNSENDIQKNTSWKCPTPECFYYYRKIYNIYETILMTEKELDRIDLKCDICAVLPYTIFSDLQMIANNIYGDEMEKTQKLELEACVVNYYLEVVDFCGLCLECRKGDWLDLKISIQLLRDYLETKDRKKLQISLNEWNRQQSIDNILNTKINITYKDFETKNISSRVLEKKTLAYMDFGIYQLYESNEVFHKQLDNYVAMDEIQFVYSPTHMEEVCRMGNSIFEGKRRDNISKICSNYEVLPFQDGCLKIFVEPVEVCFDRAKKLQILNQYAEESECGMFEALEEKTCGLLEWDEKEAEIHRKKISTLTSIQLFDPQNEMIDNESINRIFYEICGSRFPVEYYKDYCKKERTFFEIREGVRLLFILMNALGYHRNKIEKRTKFTYKAFYPTYDREFYRTIRSGFYDVDHICYASKCDYFFTCDKTLYLQAREIYYYLGCKTTVIYCNKKGTDFSLPLAVLCKKRIRHKNFMLLFRLIVIICGNFCFLI